MRSASYALAFAALVVAAALAGPAPATARTLSARCAADVQGPAYTVAGHTTHRYAVEVEHVSCAFARPWVAKLVKQSRFQRLHGPAGWTCLAVSKTRSRLASAGGCGPGKFKFFPLPDKFFGWNPDLR
jgi:hypothetical protein